MLRPRTCGSPRGVVACLVGVRAPSSTRLPACDRTRWGVRKKSGDAGPQLRSGAAAEIVVMSLRLQGDRFGIRHLRPKLIKAPPHALGPPHTDPLPIGLEAGPRRAACTNSSGGVALVNTIASGLHPLIHDNDILPIARYVFCARRQQAHPASWRSNDPLSQTSPPPAPSKRSCLNRRSRNTKSLPFLDFFRCPETGEAACRGVLCPLQEACAVIVGAGHLGACVASSLLALPRLQRGGNHRPRRHAIKILPMVITPRYQGGF